MGFVLFSAGSLGFPGPQAMTWGVRSVPRDEPPPLYISAHWVYPCTHSCLSEMMVLGVDARGEINLHSLRDDSAGSGRQGEINLLWHQQEAIMQTVTCSIYEPFSSQHSVAGVQIVSPG